jgi:hypothetical protein
VARSFVLIAFLVALAGCSSDMSAPSNPIPYSLDADGIQISGSPMRIDFDRTLSSTVPAMSKLVGRGASDQRACGAVTAVSWPDGTTLFFTTRGFAGWSRDAQSSGVICG